MSQVTESQNNGVSPDTPPVAAPIVVTIRRTPTGYSAEMVDVTEVFASVDFEDLLEQVREGYWNYGIGPQTPEELAAEEAEDRAAIDEAKANGEDDAIPWEQVRAELGL